MKNELNCIKFKEDIQKLVREEYSNLSVEESNKLLEQKISSNNKLKNILSRANKISANKRAVNK